MSKSVRFIIAIVVGLGLLTAAAASMAGRTLQNWFERDVALRAQVAVSGAQQALINRWRGPDRAAIADLLNDLTRDERIMAAAACDANLQTLAETEGFRAATLALACGPPRTRRAPRGTSGAPPRHCRAAASA